jgi:FMN phosphatase YigB (HAD superfamily)
LFDIDGTLISHEGAFKYEVPPVGADNKYGYAMRNCFGIDPLVDFTRFHGGIDRHTLWLISQDHGVTRPEFETHFSCLCYNLYNYFLNTPVDTSLYLEIPEARALVTTLAQDPLVTQGVITGNIRRLAEWKLALTESAEHFAFGLYGDEADDRVALAGMAFERARAACGITFEPEDVTVIGDMASDARCGNAIGARTVIVNTGSGEMIEAIQREKPDLLVSTLADPRVYSFLGLAN